MFHFGLIGFPLKHSLSPEIHLAAMQRIGLPGSYSLFPIEPGEKFPSELKRLLLMLSSGELHGLNVTVPYKQTVIPYLDQLTPTAGALQAVNTILYRGTRLIGDNTDAPGFMTDLQSSLPADPERTAMVLGAGGSARAVAYSLCRAGWRIVIAARRLEKAQALVKEIERLGFPGSLTAAKWDDLKSIQAADSFSLLVNCTPVGQWPEILTSPWPEDTPLPNCCLVVDLVYNPPMTQLLQTAQGYGLRIKNGTGMLVEQAALSLERWTGFTAPRQAMLAAVANYRVG